MLRELRGTVDELAFFAGFTHPPLPLAELQRRAETLAGILIVFKGLGLRCGINHISTIGHLDENLGISLREPWQHLVDISGAVSRSYYCISDERFQDYVRRCYAALAEAEPDFIWMDDDVRAESHPAAIKISCFCDLCLARFSAAAGSTWDRHSLVRALGSGERAPRLRAEDGP